MALTNSDLSKLKAEMSRFFDQKFNLPTRNIFSNLITRDEFNKQEDRKLKEIRKIHRILTNLKSRLSRSGSNFSKLTSN